MVTTVAVDGALRSRPLLLESLEPDGSLIFLTHLSSQKVAELAHDARVNVAFVGDRGDRYVSVSGAGSTTHDPVRMRALWNPTYRAWFPNGPDDPDTAIMTVSIDAVGVLGRPDEPHRALVGSGPRGRHRQVAEAGEHRNDRVRRLRATSNAELQSAQRNS